jgi:hypothetical protein
MKEPLFIAALGAVVSALAVALAQSWCLRLSNPL